jgi:hypothetical protein
MDVKREVVVCACVCEVTCLPIIKGLGAAAHVLYLHIPGEAGLWGFVP